MTDDAKPPLRVPAGAGGTDETPMMTMWKGEPVANLFRTKLLEVVEHLVRENEELKKRKCPFCDPLRRAGAPIPCGPFKGEIAGTVQESHLKGDVMVIDKIRIEHVTLDLGKS